MSNDLERTSGFGWAAMTITFIYKIPQIYKFYKSKTSNGVSLLSYIIQALGYVLYSIHGYIIDDPPVIYMGFTSFCMNMVLCSQYIYYTNNNHKIKPISEDNINNNIVNNIENI